MPTGRASPHLLALLEPGVTLAWVVADELRPTFHDAIDTDAP